jgi:tetratricopeptide (TPR) repeat protein
MMMKLAYVLTFSLVFLLGCAATQVKDDIEDTEEKIPCRRYYDFAFEYLRNGSYDDAIVNFGKAIECSTGYVEAYIGKAQAHIRKNELDDAEAVCVLGEKNVPYEPRIKVARAGVCLERQDYSAARQLYVDALSLDSLNFDALFGLGFVYEKSGDTTGAIEYYMKAKPLKPEDTALRFRLGSLLIGMGKYDEGLSEIRYVVETQPEDMEARTTLAESYIDAGRYSDALNEFKTISEKTPDNVSAVLGIGRAHVRLREYSEAAEAFKRAKSMAPDSPAPLYYLADSYINWRRYSDAEGVLREALGMEMEDKDKLPFYVLYGDLRFNQKRYEESINYYGRVLTDPTYGHYAENQINRAKARIEKKRLEEEGF